MVGLADYAEILDSICKEWDKAEEDIKVAEQIGDQVVFPSVKELRYAGRRIVDAIQRIATGGKEDEIRALLEDARFDCFRARHDAVDATIATINAEMIISVNRLGYSAVLVAFPQYSELLGLIRDAQEKVATSRSHRKDRDVIYKSVEGIEFKKIVRLARDFRSSQPIMAALAKSDRIWKTLGVVGTIFGIVATIVFGVWALL
jgi:hypothetical protein